MVGVTDPAMAAHHLIPKSLYDLPIVQHAAKSASKPYHIHHPINGIGIPNDIHNAPHLQYIDAVRDKLGGYDPNSPIAGSILEDIITIYGSLENAPPHIVRDKLIDFQNFLGE